MEEMQVVKAADVVVAVKPRKYDEAYRVLSKMAEEQNTVDALVLKVPGDVDADVYSNRLLVSLQSYGLKAPKGYYFTRQITQGGKSIAVVLRKAVARIKKGRRKAAPKPEAEAVVKVAKPKPAKAAVDKKKIKADLSSQELKRLRDKRYRENKKKRSATLA